MRQRAASVVFVEGNSDLRARMDNADGSAVECKFARAANDGEGVADASSRSLCRLVRVS